MTNRRIFFLLLPLLLIIAGDVVAQKNKSARKKLTKTAAPPKAKKQAESIDTMGSRTVVITSDFKPSLQNAAKINFTAATSIADTTKIPLSYKVPSYNLFFSYEPIAIKPLAIPADSALAWINQHQIKLGAGNLSSFFGEGRFSFGNGKKSITIIEADYISSKSNVFAQQVSKLNLDVISIFKSPKNIEWTSHAYFNSVTQYKYGYKPTTLTYTKDQLKQLFNTVSLQVGASNTTVNEAGVNFHPKLSVYRFTDNNSGGENNLIFKLPIEKVFSKIMSFKLTFDADMANTQLPTATINNNLFSLSPAVVFSTPNFILNIGLRPSWDNNNYVMLPNFTAEGKLSNSPLTLQAGWDGNFQKNSYRSLVAFNPWVGPFSTILNTQINQQFIGVKGNSGNHISYNAKIAFQQLKNQPLFLNDAVDGKTFNTVYESSMNAVKLQGEFGYTVQDNLSLLASAIFTQFNAFSVNNYAWGLVPVEITGSAIWKPLKDLQVKADLFYLGGSMYKTSSNPPTRLSPGLDLNIGGEFHVQKSCRVWLQMNNLFNNTYQRWNQYSVFGFNVMAGVVYSF